MSQKQQPSVWLVEHLQPRGWIPLIDPYASRSEKQTAIQMRHYIRFMHGVPETYRVARYVRATPKAKRRKP